MIATIVPKTLADLVELRRNDMLSINAEYQRGAVWQDREKQLLIDSVLRGYPLPVIYLHKRHKAVAGYSRDDFDVVDGQQRISAI